MTVQIKCCGIAIAGQPLPTSFLCTALRAVLQRQLMFVKLCRRQAVLQLQALTVVAASSTTPTIHSSQAVIKLTVNSTTRINHVCATAQHPKQHLGTSRVVTAPNPRVCQATVAQSGRCRYVHNRLHTRLQPSRPNKSHVQHSWLTLC